MSMISSLIDELRELALWLDDEFYDAEAMKVRDAADTIWQLRDDLQRANSENAKLRDECNRMFIANVKKNGEILRLLKENAKLRELCAGLWSVMWACAEQRCPHRHEDCFVVNGNGDGPKGHGECWYKLRMCELGIEVNR